MPDWKKIVKIIGFALLAVAFGFAIYFVFFRKPAPESAPVSKAAVNLPPLPTGQLPGARGARPRPQMGATPSPVARGGLTLAQTISSNAVVNPTLMGDQGSAAYYDRTDGRFYRVDARGSRTTMGDKRFYNVQTVSWNRTGEQAVLEYPDGSNILVNFRTHTQATLPRNWTEISFTNDSSKIVAKSTGTSEDARFLIVADPDGSNTQAVQALGGNEDRVQVAPSPSGAIIAFSRTGTAGGFGTEEVLLIGRRNENFRSLGVDGLNFEGQWSPGGRRLLGSASPKDAEFRPQLFVSETTNDGVAPTKIIININTWVDKCAFQNDDIAICAAPQNLPQGAGIARDAVAHYPDVFYRVNLATGATGLLAQPDEPTTAEHLLVAPDGSVLYFTDRATGQLKKINLK